MDVRQWSRSPETNFKLLVTACAVIAFQFNTEVFSIIKVTIEEYLQLLLNPFYARTLTPSPCHLAV